MNKKEEKIKNLYIAQIGKVELTDTGYIKCNSENLKHPFIIVKKIREKNHISTIVPPYFTSNNYIQIPKYQDIFNEKEYEDLSNYNNSIKIYSFIDDIEILKLVPLNKVLKKHNEDSIAREYIESFLEEINIEAEVKSKQKKYK